MVKTRQGWVLQSPLELLAVGDATLAVCRAALVLAVGGVGYAAAAVVMVGASLVSMVLASEMEAVASAAVSMAFAIPEVVNPAAEDVTSSVGAPTVATWPMAAGT
eukprot:g14196.t1